VGSFLADDDMVVNCVLQDPGAPLIVVTEHDLAAFAPGTLFVDVSCDEGMGFSWARATSLTEPVEVGNGVHYYAIAITARPICGTPLGRSRPARGP
jgi:alanine dehydrogenase